MFSVTGNGRFCLMCVLGGNSLHMTKMSIETIRTSPALVVSESCLQVSPCLSCLSACPVQWHHRWPFATSACHILFIWRDILSALTSPKLRLLPTLGILLWKSYGRKVWMTTQGQAILVQPKEGHILWSFCSSQVRTLGKEEHLFSPLSILSTDPVGFISLFMFTLTLTPWSQFTPKHPWLPHLKISLLPPSSSNKLVMDILAFDGTYSR